MHFETFVPKHLLSRSYQTLNIKTKLEGDSILYFRRWNLVIHQNRRLFHREVFRCAGERKGEVTPIDGPGSSRILLAKEYQVIDQSFDSTERINVA